MKIRSVTIGSLLVLISLASFALWERLPSTPPPPKAEQLTPVAVAAVRSDVMRDRIEALGTTFANESATITTTVTERVVAVHFEDGQTVRKGDPIVTLAQSEELAARNAAVEQLAEHQRELKRLESLLQNQSVARQQYDQRKTLVRITEQRIKELEARIQDRTIRAPFDGVLGLRKVSPGALVEPSDAITTLDDISQIKLDFSVPETYLGVLKAGGAVSAASSSLGGRAFQGTVDSIDTRVDPATRSIVVRAILPNPEGALKPGMLLTVTLFKNERRSMVIPEDALVPFQQRNFVWVVDPSRGSRVERREVAIGSRRPGEVEIYRGLAEGELVIVRGTDQVREGSRVQVTQQWRLPPGAPLAKTE